MSELPVPNLLIEGFLGIDRLELPQFSRLTLLTGKNGTGKTTVLDACGLLLGANPKHEMGFWLSSRQLLAHEVNYPFVLRAGNFYLEFKTEDEGETVKVLGLDGTGFAYPIDDLPFESDAKEAAARQRRRKRIPFMLVPNRGLTEEDRVACWDEVSISGEHPALLETVRLAYPSLQSLGFLVEEKVPVGLAEGEKRARPLATFGDGAVRIFDLAVAALSAFGGVLLVDEIENGIHHRVQPKIWRFLFETAHKHDVQVIATTHGRDAVAGFMDVARETPDEDGRVIRLKRSKGHVEVVPFLEADFMAISDFGIEVR